MTLDDFHKQLQEAMSGTGRKVQASLTGDGIVVFSAYIPAYTMMIGEGGKEKVFVPVQDIAKVTMNSADLDADPELVKQLLDTAAAVLLFEGAEDTVTLDTLPPLEPPVEPKQIAASAKKSAATTKPNR